MSRSCILTHCSEIPVQLRHNELSPRDLLLYFVSKHRALHLIVTRARCHSLNRLPTVKPFNCLCKSQRVQRPIVGIVSSNYKDSKILQEAISHLSGGGLLILSAQPISSSFLDSNWTVSPLFPLSH